MPLIPRALLPASGRRAGAGLLFLCLSACGGAAPQPPSADGEGNRTEQHVTGTERLGWNQRSPSLQELTAYRHWAYVDDVPVPLQARCTHIPNGSSYSCSAPLPRMGAGRHVLELTTTLTRGSEVLESARSGPVIVVVAGAPESSAAEASEASDARQTAGDRQYIYAPLATGLNVPTTVLRIPGGRLMIGERGGTLKLVGQEHTSVRVALEAGELRDVAGSEIVLHGAVLHPEFRRNAFVYVMYTEGAAGVQPVTRVARFRHVAGRLGERAILLDEIPARRFNPGGAIRFGPDGKLFVTTDDGDLGEGRSDPGVLAGKVLRLDDDGTAVGDNPLRSPVIFAGLHRPTALGWMEGSERPWLVDEALPAPPSDAWRRQVVAVHALADVSSACVYRGATFPRLTGKVVIAQGDSLRYIDPVRPETDDPEFLLTPGVGRIQIVDSDDEGFLYVGTGNTGPQEVGRDVLIRVGPRPR